MSAKQFLEPEGMGKITALNFISLLRGELAGILEFLQVGQNSLSAVDIQFAMKHIEEGINIMR